MPHEDLAIHASASRKHLEGPPAERPLGAASGLLSSTPDRPGLAAPASAPAPASTLPAGPVLSPVSGSAPPPPSARDHRQVYRFLISIYIQGSLTSVAVVLFLPIWD